MGSVGQHRRAVYKCGLQRDPCVCFRSLTMAWGGLRITVMVAVALMVFSTVRMTTAEDVVGCGGFVQLAENIKQ